MKPEKIQEFLEEEGFRPKIDDDGDIMFKYEGKTYIIQFDEDDALFIRLMLPNFWELDSDSEKAQATKISLEITRQVKVAKVFSVEDRMWSSAELFLPNEESIKPIFNKIMAVVSGAAVLFARKMHDLRESEA
ncbi:MAG: hypothetical protein ABIJ50_10985 [Pseudomonadota bacterium]